MSARTTGKGAAFYQKGRKPSAAPKQGWVPCKAPANVQKASGCKGGAALPKGVPSSKAPKGISREFCSKCEVQLKRADTKSKGATRKAAPKAQARKASPKRKVARRKAA